MAYPIATSCLFQLDTHVRRLAFASCLIGFMGALLFPAIVAHAGASPLAPQVGDTYEINVVRDSAQQGSDGSSGSSHDKDTIIERVIGLRADGLELQYDLPDAATADERA